MMRKIYKFLQILKFGKRKSFRKNSFSNKIVLQLPNLGTRPVHLPLMHFLLIKYELRFGGVTGRGVLEGGKHSSSDG
jgi:hypothetical protein